MDQLARWAPTVLFIVGWIFTYGRQTERHNLTVLRLDQHEKDTKLEFQAVRNTQAEHAERIQQGEIEIAKLQAWRDGYNAATTKIKG